MGEVAATHGPLHRFFAADHDRLDELLRRATAGTGPIDVVLFGAFRAGLLRHIGMEEKALFASPYNDAPEVLRHIAQNLELSRRQWS